MYGEAEKSSILSLVDDQFKSHIQENFDDFYQRLLALSQEPEIWLELVDKSHSLPSDYYPQDLVELDQYKQVLSLNKEGMELREVIMSDLFDMVEAAKKNGIILDLSSSFRSYQRQEQLFNYWVSQLGLEQAERESARPGTSQHQLGTTVDFGSITQEFAYTEAGQWLAREAGNYGFSLSYPDGYEELTGYIYEPWHFRYIGKTACQLQKEYFGNIQQYMLEFWNEAKNHF